MGNVGVRFCKAVHYGLLQQSQKYCFFFSFRFLWSHIRLNTTSSFYVGSSTPQDTSCIYKLEIENS